jgi:hypothetical protein
MLTFGYIVYSGCARSCYGAPVGIERIPALPLSRLPVFFLAWLLIDERFDIFG